MFKFVYAKQKKLYFIVGIVELEDGQVTTVLPECLRFADNMFGEYTWNQKGAEDV